MSGLVYCQYQMDLILLSEDGFFACLAAIGFGSISNPPRALLPWCGLVGATGHMTRTALMQCPLHLHICLAGLAAGCVIGCLSLMLAHRHHCPSEIFSFPALLPMIPGMYAYGTVQALISYLSMHAQQLDASHYLDLCFYNGMMTLLIVLLLVVGALLPKLFVKKKSLYTAIRN